MLERQFTASVYLFHEGKTLLHFHRKLQKWLPPGGHVEPNETPQETARREVKEETGLDICFLRDSSPHIEEESAISLEMPYLCLLEKIPAYKEAAAHEHIDWIFLAKPLQSMPVEEGFFWFTLEETEKLDLFPETKKILRFLLKERAFAESH